MRRISDNMMPEALIKFGIKDALADFCGNLEKQIKISFKYYGVEKRLNPDVEISLYRIAQEFLSNVHKHAEATRVAVTVKAFPEKVAITLEDNGKGFVLQEVKTRPKGQGSLGLVSMEERLRMLGSQFSLTSQAGKGTRLYFEIFRTPGHEAPGILAEAGR